MIKGEITYRSLLNYVFGVFFSVWMMIALVIVYNRFQVLSYDSVSGKAVLFSAFLMPSVVLYILMKLHREIQAPKDFFLNLSAPEKHLRAAALTAAFCAALTATAALCGDFRGGGLRTALLAAPLIILLAGFQETGFRGFLAEAFSREIPFGFSAILTGIMWGFLYFPLWLVEGAPWASLSFLMFLLNCVFLSILLNSLYLLTRSVFACMALRSAWTFLVFLFDGLMFDNGAYTIFAIPEMIVVFALMAVAKRRKGKENSTEIKI